jgi:two-component system, chemotaxis family, chemotaxis protein CheY
MSVLDVLRVMVVDDHISSRMVTVEALQQMGIKHISVAKDGREAFQKLTAEPVHLAISDLYMPDIDGFQLLRAIRAHPKLAKTGFIILTGRKDSNVVQNAVKLGVNNVIAKPFTPDVLKKSIESVVGRLH